MHAQALGERTGHVSFRYLLASASSAVNPVAMMLPSVAFGVWDTRIGRYET